MQKADSVTWTTIRSYFTDMDVEHMQEQGLDLSSYDQVVANATAIYDATSGGVMPPPTSGEPSWTQDQLTNFQNWMNAGYPK